MCGNSGTCLNHGGFGGCECHAATGDFCEVCDEGMTQTLTGRCTNPDCVANNLECNGLGSC